MDPGTAVGVVSLGIQVCQGIVQYYNRWRDYPADVEHAVRSVESLRKTLQLLGTILADSEIHQASKHRADESIQQCREVITRLEKKRQKFDSPDTVKQVLLRTFYPFKASTLVKLQELVGELLGQLSFTFQILEFNEGRRLHGIALSSLQQARADIQAVSARVDTIGEVVARIQSQNHTIAADIQTIQAQHISVEVQNGRIEEQGKQTASDVRRLVTEAEAKKLRDIIAWITPPDTAMDHDAACRKREPGTGQWFLDSEQYLAWRVGESNDSRHLWLYGQAGCGKTVLSSAIVEDLRQWCAQKPRSCLGFFYFNFADRTKQTYISMLRALLAQLLHGRPVSESVETIYESNCTSSTTTTVLETLLDEVLRDLSEIYIVVDALDECPDEPGSRPAVYDALRRIAETAHGLRVLITSRTDSDIDIAMSACGATKLSVNSRLVNVDIEKFVNSQLARAPTLASIDRALKETIAQTLSERAEGMYETRSPLLDPADLSLVGFSGHICSSSV